MDLTLLELRFPNAEFNAPYANPRQSTEEDSDPQTQEPGSGASIFPALFLVILIGTAVAAYFIRQKQQ